MTSSSVEDTAQKFREALDAGGVNYESATTVERSRLHRARSEARHIPGIGPQRRRRHGARGVDATTLRRGVWKGEGMKLGFVSAILPDLPLADVLAFAAESGLRLRRSDVLAAQRRRASLRRVTHIDVNEFTSEHVRQSMTWCEDRRANQRPGVLPNSVEPDEDEAKRVTLHLEKVIHAAPHAWARQRQTRSLAAITRNRSTTTGHAVSPSGNPLPDLPNPAHQVRH